MTWKTLTWRSEAAVDVCYILDYYNMENVYVNTLHAIVDNIKEGASGRGFGIYFDPDGIRLYLGFKNRNSKKPRIVNNEIPLLNMILEIRKKQCET